MSEQAGCGGGKQQHAGLLRLEYFGRVLRGPECAVQIDRQCFAPALRGNILGGAGRPADAGVGANDVQSAHARFCGGEKRADFLLPRDVGARGEGVRVGGGKIIQRLLVDVANGGPGAGAQKRLGDCAPYSGGAGGDERPHAGAHTCRCGCARAAEVSSRDSAFK